MPNFLHHLFLPRESNNHRGKLLHHKGLLFVLMFLLIIEGLLVVTEKKVTGVLGVTASITAQELVDLTNQKRAENSLPPLNLNTELTNAATAKSSHMFSNNYWSHVGPDGATPWGFIKSAGYEYTYAGENLARGFTTSNDVINAWMDSPGHRENMLSPNYKDVGFAIQSGTLTGDETVLVVEEFGSRSSGSVSQLTSTLSVTPTTVAVIATVTPTVRKTAIAQVLPTSIPTPTPSPVTTTPVPTSSSEVASFQSSPLVDRNTARRDIVIGVLLVILSALVIDLVLIERKKIARLFVHNLDHIIFFAILLLTILILGRGSIL